MSTYTYSADTDIAVYTVNTYGSGTAADGQFVRKAYDNLTAAYGRAYVRTVAADSHRFAQAFHNRPAVISSHAESLTAYTVRHIMKLAAVNGIRTAGTDPSCRYIRNDLITRIDTIFRNRRATVNNQSVRGYCRITGRHLIGRNRINAHILVQRYANLAVFNGRGNIGSVAADADCFTQVLLNRLAVISRHTEGSLFDSVYSLVKLPLIDGIVFVFAVFKVRNAIVRYVNIAARNRYGIFTMVFQGYLRIAVRNRGNASQVLSQTNLQVIRSVGDDTDIILCRKQSSVCNTADNGNLIVQFFNNIRSRIAAEDHAVFHSCNLMLSRLVFINDTRNSVRTVYTFFTLNSLGGIIITVLHSQVDTVRTVLTVSSCRPG